MFRLVCQCGLLTLLFAIAMPQPILGQARPPKDDDDLKYWLTSMLVDHHFTKAEASEATGLKADEIGAAVKRLEISNPTETPLQVSSDRLKVLPYPGGRHPRIGFLDGAIHPQRETKFSLFLPWDQSQYVVVDLPEALWVSTGGDSRELLYLAHTHVPTKWSKQAIVLPPLEWNREKNGVLEIKRELPNKVAFGAKVVPTPVAVRMELWLTNGTGDTLTGLKVQNCVMLKSASEFNAQTNDNKVFRDPYVACRNGAGDRWIITAWDRCYHAWGNAPCPCLHSDPQFPDCKPGQTVRLFGWLSFYEGKDIDAELKRIDGIDWQKGVE